MRSRPASSTSMRAATTPPFNASLRVRCMRTVEAGLAPRGVSSGVHSIGARGVRVGSSSAIELVEVGGDTIDVALAPPSPLPRCTDGELSAAEELGGPACADLESQCRSAAVVGAREQLTLSVSSLVHEQFSSYGVDQTDANCSLVSAHTTRLAQVRRVARRGRRRPSPGSARPASG
jgi:hypothetical protein